MDNDNEKIGVLGWFMAFMFGCSVTAVVLQVFFRYVLNNSLTWTNEFCRYTFLWVVFIGTAVLLKNDEHIAIDAVLTSVSPKVRNVLLLITYILITVLAGVITVYGAMVVYFTRGSLSSSLRLPINMVLYLSLPVGMSLTTIVGIQKAVKQFKAAIREARTGGAEEKAKEGGR